MQRLLLVTAAIAVVMAAAHPGSSVAAPAPVAEASLAFAPLTVPPPKAGRSRPLVVVVAANSGAETTDFTIPYGVLKDSGVAEVVSLSTKPGPVQLLRALRIMPDKSLAAFDAAEPAGADVIIVPAQMDPKDPALRAWLIAQAGKGATIMSICEGARVLAFAGLLEGRRATTHWSALESLEKKYPQTTWVRDQRYVQDGRMISTTGVSASIPASLALVEAIGGRQVALRTANRIGVSEWGAEHRTTDFALTKRDVSGAVGSLLAVWSHERVEFPLADGEDEIALALETDAWTRSFRSKVATTSATTEIRSAHGLRILADGRPKAGSYVIPASAAPAVVQLDEAFAGMSQRYGPQAARLARIGMEYDSEKRSADAMAELTKP